MKIRIWGCRGSIPSPGPTTLRYGGNSTCLEIRTGRGQIIIVDAGSGVQERPKSSIHTRNKRADISLPPVYFRGILRLLKHATIEDR
jgi:hypothetical protein